MTKIIVYVEGDSDKLGMETLFRDLKRRLGQKSVSLTFIAVNSKSQLVQRQPRRAARFLLEQPDTHIALMPDLYPPDHGGRHRTPQELAALMNASFARAVRDLSGNVQACRPRFKAFCFKHDFEALILAAQAQLERRLGSSISRSWAAHVEDQDLEKPPKYVVNELFRRYSKRDYIGRTDAPLILASASYSALAAACPQCFAPFVAFLESFLQEAT